MKKTIGWVAAVAAMAAAMPASAAGWYAGLSVGSTFGQVDTNRIGGDLRALGFSSVNLTTDIKDLGGRAYVGYRLRPWLAVEGYYADLGDTTWQGTVTPTGTIGARIESKAFGIALAPSFSPAKDMLVFGKLGIARAESKASFTSSGFLELENSSRKDTNTAAVYGLGAAWRVSESAFLRLDLDSHDSLGSNEIGGKFRARALNVGFGLAF
jgi:opacity protein-like surface antigen